MVRTVLRRAIWRLLSATVLIVAVASASFVLVHLAPSDFVATTGGLGVDAARMAKERLAVGLDRSLADQYLDWLGRFARFDWGTSWLYQRPVHHLVVERVVNTLGVSVLALSAATALGLAVGTWRALTPSRLTAAIVDAATAVIVSIPMLFLTLVLAVVGASTGWYAVGASPPLWGDLLDPRTAIGAARRAFLPALAIMLPVAATLERLQAQAVSGALPATVRRGLLARGLSPRQVGWVHATRLSAGPVVTTYGFVAANVLNGSLTVELFLGWPGLGRLLVDALSARDQPLVAGCVVAGTTIVLACLSVTRHLSELLDPRRLPVGDRA